MRPTPAQAFRTLAAGLLMLPLLSALARERLDKPNVLVFFTDDHGYTDLSAQGIRADIRTPHIDALASGGVRMTSGYVSAPQCVPSRAGLLAGRYQNRFGVESNGRPLTGFNAQQTIAERLAAAGYATGMAGKWHLGPGSQIPAHGFQLIFNKNSNRPGTANFDLQGNDVPMGREASGMYHLDACSAAACAFIRRFKDQPFFFYLAYRAPHVPLDAPAKYLKRFPGDMPERRRQCLAMMASVDDGIGQIMQTLRETGIEENTLVFFIADNGAPLKIHKEDKPGGGPGWDGSLNEPLNGEKGMLSEGGVRVPYIVYWKDTLPAGKLYHQPVISLDMAATASALAGLPHDPVLDGVNLIPYLRGEKQGAPHETLYWRWIAQSAVRQGKWKYLRGGEREYLYDLDADKEEKHSVLETHPELAARLRAKLETWTAALDPPGLHAGGMSSTWEAYFDFYLDGKPAPAPGASPRKTPDSRKASALQGWIARNSSATVRQGALHITPAEAGKQHPFIARANVSLTGPVKARAQLRCTAGGRAGVGWRTHGQKSFPKGQVAMCSVSPATDWQELSIDVPARDRIIHVRLLLPAATCEIRSIDLQDARGKRATWKFQTPPVPE